MPGDRLDDLDAIGWAIRSSEPTFDDWDALAAWLDADPANNDAYDRAMMAAADATDALAAATVAAPSSSAAPEQPAAAAWWRRWIPAIGGTAVAAGLAGALLLVVPDDRAASPVVIEAPIGSIRTLALADGSRIDLAGGSRLLLDRDDRRLATLARGRALFSVRHDEAHPFRVRVRGHEFVDAGTVFEVVEGGDKAAVAVAEGLVIVDPTSAAVRVAPGESVVVRADRASKPFPVARDAIGRWRDARMSFRDVPLSRVAVDLSAAWGRPISVSPPLAQKRFTGVLSPEHLRDRPDELAALLGVRIRGDATGWELLEK